jgi:predicted PurR-regulated permease PerM
MAFAFILPATVHFVVGNFIEPKMFGHRMELHPIVVLLCLAFWYAIWGVVGAILAVPVTAVLRIVLNNSKHQFARVAVQMLEARAPLRWSLTHAGQRVVLV